MNYSTPAPKSPRWGFGLPAPRVYKTLAIGAVGGAIFFHFRMPLAWMMGAMVICTIASLSGVKLQVSAIRVM